MSKPPDETGGEAILNLAWLEGIISNGAEIQCGCVADEFYITLQLNTQLKWTGHGLTYASALRNLRVKLAVKAKAARNRAEYLDKLANLIGGMCDDTEAEEKEETP